MKGDETRPSTLFLGSEGESMAFFIDVSVGRDGSKFREAPLGPPRLISLSTVTCSRLLYTSFP
jgi:hypothetical protein